jgi:hypothetical protein
MNDESGTGLVRYDAMCRAIAQAHEVDEVKDIRDKALALETYARQAKNIDAEWRACEIRLRAERKAGQLSKRLERAQGARTDLELSPTVGRSPTKQDQLTAAGVSMRQAERWEKLAEVPEEQFEAALAGPNKPTTSGIIAGSEKPTKRDERALWLRADDDAQAIRESVLADQENSLAEARVTPSIEDVATSPAGWRAPEPVPPDAPANVVTVRRGRKPAGSRKAPAAKPAAGGVSPEAAQVLKALFRSPALRDTPEGDRAGHWVDYKTINESDAPHGLAARRVPGYMAGLQRRGLVECRMDKPGNFSAKMTAAGVALAQEAGR